GNLRGLALRLQIRRLTRVRRQRHLNFQAIVPLWTPDQVEHAVRIDAPLERGHHLLGEVRNRYAVRLFDLIQQAGAADDVDTWLEIGLLEEALVWIEGHRAGVPDGRRKDGQQRRQRNDGDQGDSAGIILRRG